MYLLLHTKKKKGRVRFVVSKTRLILHRLLVDKIVTETKTVSKVCCRLQTLCACRRAAVFILKILIVLNHTACEKYTCDDDVH